MEHVSGITFIPLSDEEVKEVRALLNKPDLAEEGYTDTHE